MSRVGRFAIAVAFASGLGIGGAHAVSSLGPLDDGLDINLNANSNFNPGPGFPAQFGGAFAGEIDFTAGGGTPLQYFTSGVPGGLRVTTTGTPFQVQFTYMGAEAGNINFSWGDNTQTNLLFTSGVDTPGVSQETVFFNPPAIVSGTYLPFSFSTNGTFNCGGTQVANNGGPIGACAGTLAIAFAIVNAELAYAFFQDGDGDFDFDDMVVRIALIQPTGQTGEIPVPPAAILFGSALAAMGLLGARRRRTQRA